MPDTARKAAEDSVLITDDGSSIEHYRTGIRSYLAEAKPSMGESQF